MASASPSGFVAPPMKGLVPTSRTRSDSTCDGEKVTGPDRRRFEQLLNAADISESEFEKTEVLQGAMVDVTRTKYGFSYFDCESQEEAA